jgi:regulatory protein
MPSGSYERLLADCFRFVSFRLRSVKEIREYLSRRSKKAKTEDTKVIEDVFGRLKELGYVDDRKFAEWFIHSRQSTKPKGQRLIRQELYSKGVDRDIVDELFAVRASPDEGDSAGRTELDSARIAVRKKVQLWKNLPDIDMKRKIYGFLLRRGFSSNIVSRIIDEASGNDYNTFE